MDVNSSTVFSALALVASTGMLIVNYRTQRLSVRRDEIQELRARVAQIEIELKACEESRASMEKRYVELMQQYHSLLMTGGHHGS